MRSHDGADSRPAGQYILVTLAAVMSVLACTSSPDSPPRSMAGGSSSECAAGASGCGCAGNGNVAGCGLVPDGRQPPTPPEAGKPAGGAGSSGTVAPAIPNEPPIDAQVPSGPPDDGRGTVVAEPTDEAAHVFDQAVVHTFDVEIAPADLELVNSNPAAEQYVPARLRFEGMTYEVGYRYKGSIGAFFPPCVSVFDGRKDGKCSVKLSFNWSNPEGLFFGLKKLLFHAMNHDPSMLRERLGYSMFREMGVPASRATHAILRVNGQAGIYALVEEVDGRFTRSRFTEGGKGNLYKEIWPVHDDMRAYLDALETNEDQDPSVDRILRFKDAVEQGPDAMAEWIDADILGSYMAVDRVIMNDDGAFHFYCFDMAIGNNPTPPGNHNYYWYEAKSADRLWVIPWDLDMSMNETLGRPHIEVDWKTKPAADRCNFCTDVFGATDPPPGCDRVIQNFQAWQANYDVKVAAFIAGPFSKPLVDQKLEQWSMQLRSAGYPVQDEALSELKGILDRARMNRGFPY